MKEIKISIITVSYNSRETIIDTLKSVLKQNYRPLEYIIIDGKSSDGTCEVIEGYIGLLKEHGIEVTYISEKDNGISDAFNKGILYILVRVYFLIKLYDIFVNSVHRHFVNGK